jgi:hypothetical protein
VSDQTVGNILRRHGIAPAPKRSRTTTWTDFIHRHRAVLAGTDFFTVEVLTWRGLVTWYVLFFLHLDSREVTIGGITEHRCRVSLLIGLGLRILKDFHAWEPLKFCFIEYTFAVIKTPREPHFPSRNQRYALDSTQLPFYLLPRCFALITTALP